MEKFILERLEFYTIDIKYVEALYKKDNEVFYDKFSEDYAKKPYIGILMQAGGYHYFIPLTSAKEKHLNWKNVSRDNYLLYEMIPKIQVRPKQIFKSMKSIDKVKHILAVLEIKKMIPVKPQWYQKIDFSQVEDMGYKALLLKEYYFLKPLTEDIRKKAERIYNEQKETGVVYPFYCNFTRLEMVCDTYEG